MTTRSWRISWVFVFPWLAFPTCNLSDQEFRTLHAWLTCDECANGERAAVAAIGPKTVAMLDSALIGPSSGRQAVMRAKGEDAYRFARITGQRGVEYVEPRLENYIATYQKRAALSLGDIGNERAISALDRAIAQSIVRHYRPDVLRVIMFVRSTTGVVPFSGTINPQHVAFGGVVNVIARQGTHFSGQTRAGIPDSPFPRSQVPSVLIADTLKFVALADQGFHAVVVTNGGGVPDTAVAPLLITSLRDPNDSVTAVCADTNSLCVTSRAPPAPPGHITPFVAFLALQRDRSPRDTLDFFKIETASPLPLTAKLDWYGAANLDLRWRKCGSFASVGNAQGATFANPESTSVAIPSGQCWILVVSMAPNGGPGPAFARLRVTTP